MAHLFCCVCPGQETVDVVERFGKYLRIAQPGLNIINPFCGESISGSLSLRVQQLEVTCETKTRDNVFVKFIISVQYQVQRDSIYDAYYKLTNTKQQISSYVFDEVRAAVPKMNLDDVFTEKEEIAKNIKEQLTKSMTGYGYLIIAVLVNDIEPALKVKEAMNEINAARRMRMAAIEKAEAEKITLVKAAEAEAEAKYLQGQGIARQRQAIINGLKDSVQDFQSEVNEVTAKDVLELMLITQYFDMLRDVGSNNHSSTVFLSHNPGGLNDIAGQIRSSFMEANAAVSLGAARSATMDAVVPKNKGN